MVELTAKQMILTLLAFKRPAQYSDIIDMREYINKIENNIYCFIDRYEVGSCKDVYFIETDKGLMPTKDYEKCAVPDFVYKVILSCLPIHVKDGLFQFCLEDIKKGKVA